MSRAKVKSKTVRNVLSFSIHDEIIADFKLFSKINIAKPLRVCNAIMHLGFLFLYFEFESVSYSSYIFLIKYCIY